MAADTQLLGKRKKKIPKNPNPLFVKWLTQWKHEAAEKGISLQYTYNKALQSLKKYPLVLETGQDCLILENFGKKLCNMLDEKLTSYRSENNNTQIEINPERTISQSSSSKVKSLPGNVNQIQKHFHKRIHTLSSSDDSDCVIDEITEPLKSCADVSNSPKEKESRGGRRKEYIPNYRSGAYSILLTLLNSKQSHMTKTDLIKEAQDLCDTSFKTPPPASHYTAWSSMGILIKKGLVLKESSPAKYSLTDAGRELAQKIKNLEPPKENINSTKSTRSCGRRQNIQSKSTDTANDLASSNHLPFQSDLYTRIGTETELLSVPLQRQNNQKEVSTNLAINKNPVTDDAFPIDQSTSIEFTLQPGTFDIILCVDNCEFYGSSSNDKNLLPELIKNGVKCNLRKLHVGDFLWIAQERVYSTHVSLSFYNLFTLLPHALIPPPYFLFLLDSPLPWPLIIPSPGIFSLLFPPYFWPLPPPTFYCLGLLFPSTCFPVLLFSLLFVFLLFLSLSRPSYFFIFFSYSFDFSGLLFPPPQLSWPLIHNQTSLALSPPTSSVLYLLLNFLSLVNIKTYGLYTKQKRLSPNSPPPQAGCHPTTFLGLVSPDYFGLSSLDLRTPYCLSNKTRTPSVSHPAPINYGSFSSLPPNSFGLSSPKL
ncbi:MUS81 [Acanthosepion pharaonis]|uniref:Crossover junction endonuclease MUS81 n=1 Tax=Acanthosepion pharaonis TaxID=158019 RepID=A0A812BIE3_ACAPH|nr:MUS81 [Sepia pharaonis]